MKILKHLYIIYNTQDNVNIAQLLTVQGMQFMKKSIYVFIQTQFIFKIFNLQFIEFVNLNPTIKRMGCSIYQYTYIMYTVVTYM